MRSVEKCAEQLRTGIKARSVYVKERTNGVIRSRGMGYEKC